MTGGADRIQRLVVAGGGVAGRLAAAMLARSVPGLHVTLLHDPALSDPLVDRIGAILPAMREFHDRLGVDEAELLARSGSTVRLGTMVEGPSVTRPFLRGAVDHGAAIGGAAFHQYWIRAARAGRAAPFSAFSIAHAMASTRRFVPPAEDPRSPLSRFDYGLQLAPIGYRQMLAARCRSLGIVEHRVTIAGVDLAEDSIAAVRTDDDARHPADLFIDATGPAALLASALGRDFQGWEGWLSADRAVFAASPANGRSDPFDRAVATDAGWRFEARMPAGTSHAALFAGATTRNEDAARSLLQAGARDPEPAVTLRQGRAKATWIGNCIAIGGAATTIEPLAGAGLQLVAHAIDTLITCWPRHERDPLLLAEYNRQVGETADQVRDLTLLHHLRSGRADPGAAALPGTLADRLALFEERGRWSSVEGDPFEPGEWLAVLLGTGPLPRRDDPLTDDLAADDAERRLAALAKQIAASVAPPAAASRAPAAVARPAR